MTGRRFANVLHDLLAEISYFDKDDRNATGINDLLKPFEDANVITFEDAGLMTTDDGIVVTLTNGAEYQISIVWSK